VRVFVVDAGYYVHKTFDVVAANRNPEFIEKNCMSTLLSSVCKDALVNNATHVLVCFDGGNQYRRSIYKDYKANRRKSNETQITKKDGSVVTVAASPHTMARPAFEMLQLAGFACSRVKGYEADDLLGSAATSLVPQGAHVVLGTRDKDMASCVGPKCSLFWPTEKRVLGPDDVFAHWGVYPNQMRDFLCLTGDGVDNIPGSGFSPKTAAALLQKHGSIANCLESDNVDARKLRQKSKSLQIARKLVTLRRDINYKLDDLVPNAPDVETLSELVWKVPDSLKELGDARKAARFKGLFRR
jgi:DNA polymerase-1